MRGGGGGGDGEGKEGGGKRRRGKGIEGLRGTLQDVVMKRLLGSVRYR